MYVPLYTRKDAYTHTQTNAHRLSLSHVSANFKPTFISKRIQLLYFPLSFLYYYHSYSALDTMAGVV